MIIKCLRVKGFRSIVDETIECGQLTALLGPNGSGKSSFLRALDLFYSPAPRYSADDFYDGDTGKNIQIEIIFTSLTDEEKDHFNTYLEQEDLKIVREFSLYDGKPSDRCYGYKLRNADFLNIREETKASEQKRLYELLITQHTKYSIFPKWSNQEAVLTYLNQWERDNAKLCTFQRDDGKFFCFKKGADGNLAQYTRFLFIPAVREAANDAIEGKGSVITELMNIVVRNALAKRPEIEQLRTDLQNRYDALFNTERLPEIKNLGAKLTATLNDYVPGATVELAWGKNDVIDIPLPKADVKVMEDGYPSDIARKGHGLQRAFILTVLQHLSNAQSVNTAQQEEAEKEGEPHTNLGAQLPTLILAIEEPELYQHPARQRHFANVLLKLAGDKIAGVALRTQVLYCTHSPLFVGLDRFDEIRLLRKISSKDLDKPKITKVSRAMLTQVAEMIGRVQEDPSSDFTADTLRPRLHSLLTPWMNEGFFADVVVLVEGEDDRVAISAVARLLGHELESYGVAVIPCYGKNNLDKAAAIFLSLDIPIYLIWDSDQHFDISRNKQNVNDIKQAKEGNRRLLRLMDRDPQDWPHEVAERFACFATNLDMTLMKEMGEDHYTRILNECQREFGILKMDHAKKNPAVIHSLLKKAKDSGKRSKTLEQIIGRIIDLKSENRFYAHIRTPSLPDVLLDDAEEMQAVHRPAFIQSDTL